MSEDLIRMEHIDKFYGRVQALDDARDASLERVKMNAEIIAPIVLVPGHEHPNPITPKLEMHSLVLDIANAV